MVKETAAVMAERAESCSAANKYKGVRKRKWGKWVSEIRLPNSRERIWLGSYDSPEKAARAFDAALFCLRGNSATFNFPDQPPQIPGGRSLPPSEIQSAAARYANQPQHSTHDDVHNSNSSSLCNSFPSPVSTVQTPFFDDDFSSSSSSSCMNNNYNYNSNSNNNINMLIDTNSSNIMNTASYCHDYWIYSGFDDPYFITTPPVTDYQDDDDICDGAYLQQPSFLWNF